MCLSTAFEHDQNGRVLMENVKSIQCDKEYITLTDLLERSCRFSGSISFVDLVGGVVVIDCHEE